MLLVEKIERWREVGSIDDPLLFRLEIAGEARNAVWTHPDATVRHFGVAEDVRLGEFILLALRRLSFVWTQGRDVDQRRDARVHAGMRDDRASIGVANKNDRTADPTECADRRLDIAFQRVQTVLRGHYLVTLRPKRRDELLEA